MAAAAKKAAAEKKLPYQSEEYQKAVKEFNELLKKA